MGLLPALNDGSLPRDSPQQLTSSSLEIVDSMATPDNEIYGPTSGISFHSLLLDTLLPGFKCIVTPNDLQGILPTDGAFITTGNMAAGFLGVEPGDRISLLTSDFPDMETAEKLWAFFFSHTHCLYPLVNGTSLKKSYQRILATLYGSPSTKVDSVLTRLENQPLFALHLLILALAKNLSEPHDDGKCELRDTKFNLVRRIGLRLLRNHLDWPHSVLKGICVLK
jgi:hypothetical protein